MTYHVSVFFLLAFSLIASPLPTGEIAYVKASNTDAGDNFGYSLAMSGDRMVVGALFEDGDGISPGNSLPKRASGAAYVYLRQGATWVEEAYIKAPNPDLTDFFGEAIAISGDTMVVGAMHESSNGVGGQLDNSVASSGAAYVFVRSGSSWVLDGYLKATVPQVNVLFGSSVAVSGDTVVVGSPWEGAGAAYVFRRGASGWSNEARLEVPGLDPDQDFGENVAIDGDTIVIGAPDVGASLPGQAYVFSRVGTVWGAAEPLTSSSSVAGDGFGASVAASGGRVVVGARSGGSGGAAYVFSNPGSGWIQEAELLAPVSDPNDLFGDSVAIDGTRVVVGAIFEDGEANRSNGDPTTNGAPFTGSTFNAGAAYVFEWDGAAWVHRSYLKPHNREEGDSFGRNVAISGDLVGIAATGEDSSAIGIDADAFDNFAEDSGAAYVFSLNAPPAPILNLSARGWVDAGDDVLIGGVIIGGTGTKRVLVTGRGPSMPSSVPDRLSDPNLSVFDANGVVIASNGDWENGATPSDVSAAVPTISLDSQDAALVLDLVPGAYTVIVGRESGAAGIGIVEIFDADPSSPAVLLNLSTRSLVGTGDRVLIGGVIVGGSRRNADVRVVQRGRGASLPSSLPNRLVDPLITRFNAAGVPVRTDDDWATGLSATELTSPSLSTYAPGAPTDAAIVEGLAPGGATVILQGSGGGEGTGIVEIFVTP